MATSGLTRTQRETLKAIHRLQPARVGGAHTGDLAGALGRSVATVSAVLKDLAARGLVDHRPYHGAELTEKGWEAAAPALRRQRIVECFLADVLGFDAGEVRRLATTFEHALPAEVERRLDAALGCPDTCPHGSPIPRERVGRSASANDHDIQRRERAC